MNVALEQTEEYSNGRLTGRFGECFLRGNNGTFSLLNFIYAFTSPLVYTLPPLLSSTTCRQNRGPKKEGERLTISPVHLSIGRSGLEEDGWKETMTRGEEAVKA
jgi:hypothetical protein